MKLWTLPDSEKTAKRVNWFLTTYLTRLSLLAGEKLIDISSPSFNSLPSGSSENSVEQKMQRGLEAMEALKAIKEAMLCTMGHYPDLLIKFYFEHEPVWQIRQELFIDHNSFRKHKAIALNQFADAWETIQEKYNFEDKIDLHVYSQSDNDSELKEE